MPRYGIRFANTWIIPTTEVTEPVAIPGDLIPWNLRVKRLRGFTRSHAMSRAIRWSREHGDPR